MIFSQKFSSESIILGGDFNCPLSKEDKEGGRDFSHKHHVAEEIKSLMCSLDLEDEGRKLHQIRSNLPGEHQIKKLNADYNNLSRVNAK